MFLHKPPCLRINHGIVLSFLEMITVEKLVFPPIPTDSHRLFHGDIPIFRQTHVFFYHRWFPMKSPLHPKSRKQISWTSPSKIPMKSQFSQSQPILVGPIPRQGHLGHLHAATVSEALKTFSSPGQRRIAWAWHQWRSCKIYQFLTMVNYGQYELIAHPPAKYQPLTMIILYI